MDWVFQGNRHGAVAVVFRVKEQFGDLSNMSNVFPLLVQGIPVRSSEALYQAMRYPHQPDWQREILAAPHAMRSKMASKKQKRQLSSRPDWEQVREDIMRWCLGVKASQHFGRFSRVLLSSGDRKIVERSRKDRFWGAVPVEDDLLEGENRLGRLLMELRDEFAKLLCSRQEPPALPGLVPPEIANLSLLGQSLKGWCSAAAAAV